MSKKGALRFVVVGAVLALVLLSVSVVSQLEMVDGANDSLNVSIVDESSSAERNVSDEAESASQSPAVEDLSVSAEPQVGEEDLSDPVDVDVVPEVSNQDEAVPQDSVEAVPVQVAVPEDLTDSVPVQEAVPDEPADSVPVQESVPVEAPQEAAVSAASEEPARAPVLAVRQVVSDARIHQGAIDQVSSEGSATVIVMLSEGDGDDAGRGLSALSGLALSRERAERAKTAFKDSLESDVSVSNANVRIERELYTIGVMIMQVDEAGLAALQQNPHVARVLPNGVRSINRGTISGAGISLDESGPLVNSDDVANLTVNGVNLSGIGQQICVIDTGIDTSHLFFGPVIEASNIVGGVFGGYDFVNNDSNATDDNSHGTHVSGIAVGNISPYFGTARNAQVVPVKVCNAVGSCPDAAILAGVDYCINNHTVNVISGSIGGGAPLNSTTCSSDPLYATLEPLLSDAANVGIIPVFASGNNGCLGTGCTTGVDYPACSPQVISVGSTTKADVVSTFTDRGGDRFDIFAPGQQIESSVPVFNLIQNVSGTSQATPHVSGAIAVLQQNEVLNGRSNLNLTTVRQLLQQTGVFIAPNNSRIDILGIVARRNANLSLNHTASAVREFVTNSTLDFAATLDLGQVLECMDIRTNFVGVNSTLCPQYDQSAHVILGGITSPAQPLVDGVACPLSICENVTLSSRGLEMDVNGFSNFTSVPGCGITINESASLNQSINATATCITFGADNIELDCNGFTIGYANTSLGYGINATGRSNITIRNCVVNQSNASVSSAHAIFLSGTNDSLLSNVSVNITASPGAGVYIDNGEGVVLERSLLVATLGQGLFISGTDNVTIQDNVASGSSGLQFEFSTRTSLTNNSVSVSGIALSVGLQNQGGLIRNNSLSSTTNRGLYITNPNVVARENVVVGGGAGATLELSGVSGNVSVLNSRVHSVGPGPAVVFNDANGSTIANVTVFTANVAALSMSPGSQNVFANSSFAVNSGTVVQMGMFVFNTANNTFSNVTFESNTSYFVTDAGSLDNNFTLPRFLNTSAASIRFANFTLPGSAEIGQSNLSIGANFTRVNATALPFLNQSAQITFEGLPFVNPRPLVDFQDDGSFEKCSMFPSQCQEISYNGSTFVFNVSNFTSYAASETIFSCPETIVEDTTLNQSLNGTGTCITFGADNIELDCNGFTIGYAGNETGVGVNVTGHSNVTIRNCIIRQSNATITNSDGILLSDANDSLVTNVTINTSGATARGIEFVEANGNIVELSEVNASSQGIDLTSNSQNNTLRHSLVVTPTTTAVLVLGSSNGFVARNNSLRGGGGGSLTVAGGSVGAVIDNNSLDSALSLQDSDHVVERNIITALASGAMDIQATNVTVRHNMLFTTGSDALVVNQVQRSSFVNNTVRAASADGLSMRGASNNSFANSSFATSSGAAISFVTNVVDAQNNTFENVTLESNNTWISASAASAGNNLSNVSFKNVSAAQVLFGNFTLPVSTIIGQSNLSLGDNFTRVNSSALSFLNQSAQITLRNLNLTNPRPLIDVNDSGVFLECDPPQCSVVSSTPGVLVFNVAGFTTYSSAQGAGVVVTKSDSLDPVVRGALLNYTILINNTNNESVFNVSVVEGYPAGVSFISSSPVPSVGNGTFNLGTLLANTSTAINITVRVGSNVVNGTVLNNTANVSSQHANGTVTLLNVSELTVVQGIPTILTSKADSPDPVPRGTTLSYTINVTNSGDEVAYNVTVTEGYPAGVVFNGSSPLATMGNNVFSIGNLTPSASFLINITVNVSPALANGTVLNNSYNVTFANLTGTNATVTNSTLTTVLGSPNLSVNKTDSIDPVFAGDQLVYRITLNNTGDDTAFNVTVFDLYPLGVSFVASQPVPTSGNNTFVIASLAPNVSTTINITVLVNGLLPNGTVLNNSINATFANRSGQNTTFNASQDTTVIGSPVISVNKTANQTNVTKGTTLNYTITVNNTGNSPAFNVTVFELYPTGVAFVSSEPAPTTGNSTFNVGDLLPNQSTTINLTINFSVTLTNATLKNNSLNVTANRTDGRNVSVQNASAVVTVVGFPQISVLKSDTPDPVVNGTVLTYVITVTNGGDEIAYNVTVTEGYPANVTLLTTQPTPTPDNATFPIGNLLPGQTFLINITVNVSGGMTSGQLNNSVNVTFANASGVSLTLQNSTLTTVIPPPPVFVGGGGGGGGGGASGVSTTQSMSGSSWSSNYLRAGDKVNFRIDADALDHTMTVLSVLTDRVTIRVASVPQEFTIKKGVVQAVDVDLDGKQDLRVSVTDIAYSKALFLLEKAAFSPAVVHEPPKPAPAPAPKPAAKEEAPPAPAPEPVAVPEPLSDVVPVEAESVAGKWLILAGMLVVIAGVAAGAVLFRKNRGPRSTGDPMADAKRIDDAVRDMKKGMRESEHLVKQAERLGKRK